ncbi:hypothetical protein [Bradyrhizobium japonicum]|uniref:hypothetical protein n=1 Tax=Bradyrhizobium japonicum TaxID=375 RepID=UPI001BA9D590|nr:hypothetical protein [Bradyrhizobium japonicum]MBR0959139.1 hypothetical protein [Bradyrhizobium japonicum]
MTLPPELVPAEIDRHVSAMTANTMPPRDPDDDEEEEEERQDDEGNQTDEPPVVREPDED